MVPSLLLRIARPLPITFSDVCRDVRHVLILHTFVVYYSPCRMDRSSTVLSRPAGDSHNVTDGRIDVVDDNDNVSNEGEGDARPAALREEGEDKQR